MREYYSISAYWNIWRMNEKVLAAIVRGQNVIYFRSIAVLLWKLGRQYAAANTFSFTLLHSDQSYPNFILRIRNFVMYYTGFPTFIHGCSVGYILRVTHNCTCASDVLQHGIYRVVTNWFEHRWAKIIHIFLLWRFYEPSSTCIHIGGSASRAAPLPRNFLQTMGLHFNNWS